MERYFKRSFSKFPPTNKVNQDNNDKGEHSSKRSCSEFDPTSLPADPGLRPPITSYHPNVQDEVRRTYLQRGPCQPRDHVFPQKEQGKGLKRFNPSWFDEHCAWLEYSVYKDAAYCLYCFLFKVDGREHAGSCDTFVIEGFTNWKRKEKIQLHVGGPNSTHNKAWKNCQVLLKQEQHIETIMNKQTQQARIDYRIRLNASIDCVRFLLRQGLPFRGHDESNDSNNQGNFLECLKLLADHNKEIKRVSLDRSPGNLKLITPEIQKDITRACAIETTNVIIKDLGNSLFSILVDEARDVSIKEQMAIVLRYVDKRGHVIERILGIVHVADTTALSLKAAIEAMFLKHNLSISRLHGQGYDGASNMQGEFNGLKALILKENAYAFSIHCFAHQLQLAIIAVAKNNVCVDLLFALVTSVVNIVGASCKRKDIL